MCVWEKSRNQCSEAEKRDANKLNLKHKGIKGLNHEVKVQTSLCLRSWCDEERGSAGLSSDLRWHEHMQEHEWMLSWEQLTVMSLIHLLIRRFLVRRTWHVTLDVNSGTNQCFGAQLVSQRAAAAAITVAPAASSQGHKFAAHRGRRRWSYWLTGKSTAAWVVNQLPRTTSAFQWV